MRAAVLHRFGAPLTLEEVPDPEAAGEAVAVRVLGAGVCRSDLHLADGRYPNVPLPLILGHEIAGEVEGLGPVLVQAAWGCGSCRLCERGEEQLCESGVLAGWDRHGGYAERVLVPSRRYLLPLEGLDPVRAAPLADAGVTAYRAVRRAREWLREGGRAVVIGVGGLGQFAVQLLRLGTDTPVAAVDVAQGKRERALELGAEEAASPDRAADLGPARAVLDFVGSDESLALAVRLVERTGIVVLVGEAGGHYPFGHGVVPPEVHLTTAISGSRRDLASVLDLARRGDLDWHVEALPLDRVNEALARLRRGDVLGRLVLVP